MGEQRLFVYYLSLMGEGGKQTKSRFLKGSIHDLTRALTCKCGQSWAGRWGPEGQGYNSNMGTIPLLNSLWSCFHGSR